MKTANLFELEQDSTVMEMKNPRSNTRLYCTRNADGILLIGEDYPLRVFMGEVQGRALDDEKWAAFLKSNGLEES